MKHRNPPEDSWNWRAPDATEAAPCADVADEGTSGLLSALRAPKAEAVRTRRACAELLGARLGRADELAARMVSGRRFLQSAPVREALGVLAFVVLVARGVGRARETLVTAVLFTAAAVIAAYALCGRPGPSVEIRPDPQDAPLPSPNATDAQVFAQAGGR